MVHQPTPMLRSSTVEKDLESNDRVPTGLPSEESTELNTPSEKKDDEETVSSPVSPTPPGAGHSTDGGLAAWAVVLGVSQSNRFPLHCLFEFFPDPVSGPAGLVCSFLDVCCVL